MYEIPLKIIFLIAVPFIGLFVEGIRRKLIARFQNRIGPPIVQPFYDIIKLWNKEQSSSKGYQNLFFLAAPFLFFIATYALFIFIPFPLISFNYDFIFLIYLTILGSAFYILASVSSTSPFGIVGGVREMIVMYVYEISLAVVIVTFFLHAGSVSIAGFTSTSSLLAVQLPLASFCLLCIALIEIKITPFDTVEAGAEIYAGPTTEFSGKGLAFLSLATWMKIPFYIFLVAMLLLGTLDLTVFAIGSLFLLFLFPLLRATTSRYRVDQAFLVFTIILVLSLINLIFVL